MSPSPGPLPRTPDRRSSSSALFGAFRTLTGGRLKSATPPPSASSATATPTSRPSLAAHRPHSVATETPVKHILEPVDERRTRQLLGGPPELDPLVEQLRSSRPFQERAAAVEKICAILEEYPVRNVHGLWSIASDLLAPDQCDEVAGVGYMLLKSCVALPDLTPVERKAFFDAASQRRDDPSFNLRLQIVTILTEEGRNVAACESSTAHFILVSLETCFKESGEAYKAASATRGKKKAERPIQEVENMNQLFQFAISVCKFNAKTFDDKDLDLLLERTMVVCQETCQRCDIENAVKLFDTIITYVHIPPHMLQSCLEVLCSIHRQIKAAQEQTWNTLTNLFKSHVGQAAVSALLHTLLDGPTRKHRQGSLYRGTIQVLEQLLLEDGRNGLPKVPVSLLFPALRSSIQDVDKVQERFVVDLIAAILEEERLTEILLEEADWSNLIDIIRTCAERDDDRYVAKATTAAEKVLTEKAASATDTSSLTASQSPLSTHDDADTDAILNSEPSSVPPSRTAMARRYSEDEITRILINLDSMSSNMEFVQKAAIMELFMRLAHRLSDSTAENMIQFYAAERYLHPSNEHWLEACRSLVAGILKDYSRPRSLRVLSIRKLRETYNTVEGLCASDTVLQCGALLINNIEPEEDVEVLYELVDFAVDVADRASDASFPDTAEILKRRLERQTVSSHSSTSVFSSPSRHAKADTSHGSACNVIAAAFVRLFTRSVVTSARKTRLLYDILRYIAANDRFESDGRLTALKLLFRMRADSNHSLFVSASSEGESIAAVLCRTAETAVNSDRHEDIKTGEYGRQEDPSSWRDQRKVSGSSPRSSLNRHTSRHGAGTGRVARPVPPLWTYPGPKGLPEEPSPQPSRMVFSHIDVKEYPLSEDVLDVEVTLWLELVISLLQKSPDWEIYSYALVHLGPQLSNQSLVRSCVPQLQMLRNVVCEHVRSSNFREPPSHTLLKKADVAVCLYHILTVLISYHDYFEKSEEDELVKAFLHGVGYWDRTSKWCIHALYVCCFEVPLSVSKSLDNIIQKMSQIITKPSTAIHILEFLTSLARMPELYKNFREDEFKMVFGVSFRYLQHIRDHRDRVAAAVTTQNGQRSLRHSGTSRDFAASPDQSSGKTASAADDLPQYLYSLAYHVITFWFMGLKMEDRPKQIPWITKNLQYTDSTGRQVLEEQGQVIVDMMNMVAYSDRDETTRDPNFARPADGEVWKKRWILGHSLMTIETAARTGVSLITSRRPCGTRYLYQRPLLAPDPSHQVPLVVGSSSEAFDTSANVEILPEYIFQTYYAPLILSDPPIILPDDDMSRRAIASFDRISTVDSYKVGVVYIGEGQTHEMDILMNDIGSGAYSFFISDLGTLVRLKGAKFNTGGLDTRGDTDGQFTYCWRDRCVELVFHITTMMPTDRADAEMTYPNKKRHIGNDFVTIVFNDSGLPYNFDTFPSAFNYVHIVIAPESRASFVDARRAADPDGRRRYYKVQVLSRPGFPDISPAAETKILCGVHLAGYCRLIAINASVFSQVWSARDGAETSSSWRNRLRQIKRLRERYGAGDAGAAPPITLTASPGGGGGHVHQGGGAASPPARENHGAGAAFNRASIATFMSEGTSRSSVASNSHD
ncbi:hypothetical protein BDV95DRAFT_479316 [Massariosphaeria phaeospora]|uniref:Rap-GAP domain-containing protein n=1 Tax=Massariosphaeria phaeospora TaxID=100035 RepID=A0A7C8IJ71_9PLEO|nr:hypothetical protein BDV95DRAFT_479316 [Massariosphaeria phaeospora]